MNGPRRQWRQCHCSLFPCFMCHQTPLSSTKNKRVFWYILLHISLTLSMQQTHPPHTCRCSSHYPHTLSSIQFTVQPDALLAVYSFFHPAEIYTKVICLAFTSRLSTKKRTPANHFPHLVGFTRPRRSGRRIKKRFTDQEKRG